MWLYFISQSKCKLQTILSVSSLDNGTSDESIERNVVQALTVTKRYFQTKYLSLHLPVYSLKNKN